MVTVSTIGSAGGRNYSTPAAWIAAFASGGWEGDLYKDSEFIITSSFTISGNSTSPTNYILLTTGPGQSFVDNAGAASNPLYYDHTKGVGLNANGNAGQTTILALDANITVSKVQFNQPSAGSYPNGMTFWGATVSQCIMVGDLEKQLDKSCGVYNCLMVTTGSNHGGVGNTGAFGSLFVNCTVVHPAFTTGASAWDNNYFNLTIINCAWFGFVQSGGRNSTLTGNNNASDLSDFGTTAFTGTNLQGVNPATVFADAGWTNDFRLVTGSPLIDAGDDTNGALYIPAAIDIIGTHRPQSTHWDIGAWEFKAAGGATATAAWAGIGTFAAHSTSTKLVSRTVQFAGVGAFAAIARAGKAVTAHWAGIGTFAVISRAGKAVTTAFHGIGTFFANVPGGAGAVLRNMKLWIGIGPGV